MSIRAVKLKTGEEIIADIEGISKVGDKEVLAEQIVLDKPFSIHLVPQQEGIGIQMIPWALYAKENSVPYPSSDINFCIEPSTSLRNEYASMVGLPTIPDDKIVIPEGGTPNLKLST